MSLFRILLQDHDRKRFDTVVGLIMEQSQKSAHYYASHPEHGVVLFWKKPVQELFVIPGDNHGTPINQLPYPLKSFQVADFLWGFLGSMKSPSMEGLSSSAKIGHLVSSGDWDGKISGCSAALLYVTTRWIEEKKDE